MKIYLWLIYLYQLLKQFLWIWIFLFGIYTIETWKEIEANKIQTQIEIESYRKTGG